MNAKKNKLEQKGLKVNPFNVPRGYFENFSKELISQLPERQIAEPKVVSLFEHIKPWLYMAAMFIGIALMVNLFVKNPTQNINNDKIADNKTSLMIPVSEIDEYYSFYEEQLASTVYRKTFYLEELPNENFIESNNN